jgi:hypothetical protein
MLAARGKSVVYVADETHNLIANLTGAAWRSYDGADAPMRTVNNDPNIACPNANWNGATTNYCSDVTGDDTVAHEWGHAYSEYSHGLIYAWQPGALNESHSDIWGEIVDPGALAYATPPAGPVAIPALSHRALLLSALGMLAASRVVRRRSPERRA